MVPTEQLEEVARDWVRAVTGLQVDTVPQFIQLLRAEDDTGFKLARGGKTWRLDLATTGDTVQGDRRGYSPRQQAGRQQGGHRAEVGRAGQGVHRGGG